MTSNIKLSCRNIWKLYGADTERFLKNTPAPTGSDLKKAGIIGAVRNASIDIAEGEIFVIMGLSGSGKSTLVRCLSRLIEPTGGEVLFDGIDLLRATDKEMIEIRRHKLGMVFQHFALLPHLTVLQNVMFPLTVQAAPKAQAEAKAREVVELVGLKGREDNYPRELSGGQQQRVGIARSLVVEPHLWFLDEPFSALDPLIRREMQDEFLSLQARLHKTIVFITHDFDEAVRLADRIAIMKDGEIIQVATPEELVVNPASDYVEEFTKHIPRSKVLTAGGLMTKGAGGSGPPIRQTDRISAVAERIIMADGPVPVADNSGQIVGSIDRQAIAHVLFGAGGGE
ncbi:Glycine betaine/L-proline transport ATP-binding protein ProV [Roseovarius litorisediminis]|uniref:Quaternary amine transport ATP-binding protein n=1 Tax=Roseovarius litorisediminis TaxID=1312363 RepID=A0A1Y5T1I0_9RHOB|nr:betaine/proline/choline family ABC transporter ATP-binding protein [Roseovarius litorisediminis]SLN50044.1 Glycine betaine/L-proline transport ATP-binding protein ProV [Roseovarius litorisediminis]